MSLLFFALISHILPLYINLTNFDLLKRRGTRENKRNHLFHIIWRQCLYLCFLVYFNIKFSNFVFLSGLPLLLSVWTIRLAFLCVVHLWLFLFLLISCFLVYLCTCGVRELTLLFSHLQRQRNHKKVLQNSHHTLLSGLRPYSSPYLSGDRYGPLAASQHIHPDRWQRAKSYSHTTGTCFYTHKVNPPPPTPRLTASGAFCMDLLCVFNSISLTSYLRPLCYRIPPTHLQLPASLSASLMPSPTPLPPIITQQFPLPVFPPSFLFISIVSFLCHPSFILHLFSGRQKFHAGLFYMSCACCFQDICFQYEFPVSLYLQFI